MALQFRRIQATVSRFGHVVTRDIETLTGMDITSTINNDSHCKDGANHPEPPTGAPQGEMAPYGSERPNIGAEKPHRSESAPCEGEEAHRGEL